MNENGKTIVNQDVGKDDIRVRLIENGVIVRVVGQWLYFTDWARASAYIDSRLTRLRQEVVAARNAR